MQGNETPRRSQASGLNLPSRNQTLPAVEQRTLEQLLGLPNQSNSPHNWPNNALNSTGINVAQGSDLVLRPDKVSHIIHNWKVRFSGESRGMSVDNFLYRVEALTNQTLNGNFEILCDHISTLFDAKANDWFWRYHRSVPSIKWPDLCSALRKQYKDSRTDIDLREMIRDRKQKCNENFDAFYESVIDISDRLVEPLSENILVEILRRNLLPEIQHEILNLKIYSVSELRDICRRREFFLQDIGRRQNLIKSVPFVKRQIHELDEEPAPPEEDEISAIALACWNCRQPGHRYQDCLEDRQVFCYGCGMANVYKPKCTNCSSKNFKSSALKSAHRQNQSTGTD